MMAPGSKPRGQLLTTGPAWEKDKKRDDPRGLGRGKPREAILLYRLSVIDKPILLC